MWLVIGIALPFASSRFRGIRNPQDALIHDEMTYLVQADTFSRGRLTNPAPRHPEFFEAPYLLMEPTYQAKYPPAQCSSWRSVGDLPATRFGVSGSPVVCLPPRSTGCFAAG